MNSLLALLFDHYRIENALCSVECIASPKALVVLSCLAANDSFTKILQKILHIVINSISINKGPRWKARLKCWLRGVECERAFYTPFPVAVMLRCHFSYSSAVRLLTSGEIPLDVGTHSAMKNERTTEGSLWRQNSLTSASSSFAYGSRRRGSRVLRNSQRAPRRLRTSCVHGDRRSEARDTSYLIL